MQVYRIESVSNFNRTVNNLHKQTENFDTNKHNKYNYFLPRTYFSISFNGLNNAPAKLSLIDGINKLISSPMFRYKSLQGLIEDLQKIAQKHFSPEETEAKAILVNKIIEDDRFMKNNIFVKNLPELLEETKTKAEALFKTHIIDKFTENKSSVGNCQFVRNYMSGILKDTKTEEALDAKYDFFYTIYKKIWQNLNYRNSYSIQNKNEIIMSDISEGIETKSHAELRLKAIMNIYNSRDYLNLEDFVSKMIKQIKTENDLERFNKAINYALSLNPSKKNKWNFNILPDADKNKVLTYFEIQLPTAEQNKIAKLGKKLKKLNPCQDSKEVDNNKIQDLIYLFEQNLARGEYSKDKLEQIYTVLSNLV